MAASYDSYQPGYGVSAHAMPCVLGTAPPYAAKPTASQPPRQGWLPHAGSMPSLRSLKLTLATLALSQLGWLAYVIHRTSTTQAAGERSILTDPVSPPHLPPPPPPLPTPSPLPLPPPPPSPLSPPPPSLQPVATDPAGSPLEHQVLEVCGTAWQDAYASAHAAWSRDGANARALVFEVRGTSGGLADRLTGMMTALLLAVLSDRAFVLDWPEHTAVLRTPRIDATALLPALARASAAEQRRVVWINGDRQKLAQQTASDLAALWPERVVRLQR